jgi:transcriptional regulator with XRE-family HTH domain
MQLRKILVQNLRKIRKERGITQAALAEMCGTDTSYIGQIEIGKRFPSLDLIEKMAKVLKIRPHLLFFIESDDDTDEKILKKKKKDTLSDTKKEELTNRLTDAIRKIVKNID